MNKYLKPSITTLLTLAGFFSGTLLSGAANQHPLLVVGTAVAYFVGSIFNGLNKADKDHIQALKDINDVLKEEMAELHKQNDELRHENNAQEEELRKLGELKNMDDENTERMLQILQNRSPELEQTLTKISKSQELILDLVMDIYKGDDN